MTRGCRPHPGKAVPPCMTLALPDQPPANYASHERSVCFHALENSYGCIQAVQWGDSRDMANGNCAMLGRPRGRPGRALVRRSDAAAPATGTRAERFMTPHGRPAGDKTWRPGVKTGRPGG